MGKLKHKHHDKESHWHLTKKHDCSDHHWEDESSESSSSSSDHHHHPNHHIGCVEEVLKAILHAQKKAKKHKECENSCKESIRDLLGENKKYKKNTIPFILYCGDCEPFKATGVTTFTSHSHKEKFACITSFIFKIKDIEDGCAVLELLTFKKCHSSESGKKGNCSGESSPCCQIHCKDVDDLVKTGICITVDLSCFCAITCLPAVCL